MRYFFFFSHSVISQSCSVHKDSTHCILCDSHVTFLAQVQRDFMGTLYVSLPLFLLTTPETDRYTDIHCHKKNLVGPEAVVVSITSLI